MTILWELKKTHLHKILISIFFLYIFPLNFSFGQAESNSNDSFFEFNGAVLTHIHKIGSGYGSEPSQKIHKHLKAVGYDTVQLNTFAYLKNRDDTKIYVDVDPTMKDEFIEQEIRSLRNSGFKVMLKPHVWVGGWSFNPDNWRSKIDFTDSSKREEWFRNYSDFIVSQAELAERNNVEIFVVGTELVGLSKYTMDWRRLIQKVREVYGGKLTYAAEGWNAKNIQFWGNLDYIGIDAYFPLANEKNPTIDELVNGWSKYEKDFKNLSDKYDKKIIFAEIGFKSHEGSTIKPWEWNHDGKPSEEEQANAFKATYLVFHDKPYLAGFFVWKYFTDMNSYERPNIEKGFTPYGKTAEKIISEWVGSDK